MDNVISRDDLPNGAILHPGFQVSDRLRQAGKVYRMMQPTTMCDGMFVYILADVNDLPDPGDEVGCIKCGLTGEEWLNVSGGDGWTGKPCPHCAKEGKESV